MAFLHRDTFIFCYFKRRSSGPYRIDAAIELRRFLGLPSIHTNAYRLVNSEGDSSVISSFNPLGWMYQERALYCEGKKKCDNLDKATKLDPIFNYLYMYRAACLMRKQSVEAALAEINRVLGFKLALECLELRFCFYLALEDYRAPLCDVQAILTLSPKYRMFEGRVAATQLCTLMHEYQVVAREYKLLG
ncbi:hypothetical protein IFM89_012250 [Coptis chinensis]|uniref:Uncharacterized protein n=1 Tax=Coptis chinensis TaxID=261450 RepID=A0A835HBZ3_9MAGN|nr:hypothetical protein IFM89_012250 [Coptis chinensis]